jgi:hypothetical protein
MPPPQCIWLHADLVGHGTVSGLLESCVGTDAWIDEHLVSFANLKQACRSCLLILKE